ncbi:MAG: hypothetical protein IPI19_01925 [Ignavibacteriales bacterium]|nr:hypothetical protein [Ignavibacteriales bacterium]
MKSTLHIENDKFNWRKISPRKFVKTISIIVGTIFLVSILILVLFRDSFINSILKSKIINAFTNAYPEYSLQIREMHYSIWSNRLECDSIMLNTKDPNFTCSLDSFSVSGINWIKILFQSDFNPTILSSSVIDGQNIVFNFLKSQEELRLGKLHISVMDSVIISDSIKYHPSINDVQFFANSQFRKTRSLLDISQIKILGFDFLSFLKEDTYSARKIIIHEVFADVLLNKDKPKDENEPNPLMPNEILSSIKKIINIDSLEITNGRLKYSERFEINAIPGVITFNKFNILVSGISNQTAKPETTIILANGLFMNTAPMKVFMAIPLTSKKFSLRYSGTVGKMDVSKLNVFLEPVENRHIQSGIIQSAYYSINVNSGKASGNLRVAYTDLSLAISNKDFGFDLGLFNHISNFIGDMFIIRTTNIPDENGSMKIGEINYTRNPGEYFFQYLWLSLRSGVADVVGF